MNYNIDRSRGTRSCPTCKIKLKVEESRAGVLWYWRLYKCSACDYQAVTTEVRRTKEQEYERGNKTGHTEYPTNVLSSFCWCGSNTMVALTSIESQGTVRKRICTKTFEQAKRQEITRKEIHEYRTIENTISYEQMVEIQRKEPKEIPRQIGLAVRLVAPQMLRRSQGFETKPLIFEKTKRKPKKTSDLKSHQLLILDGSLQSTKPKREKTITRAKLATDIDPKELERKRRLRDFINTRGDKTEEDLW